MAILIGGSIAAALGLGGVTGYVAWSRSLAPDSPYDVVLDIPSLRNFSTDGWPIELRSEPVGQDPSATDQSELSTRNLVAVLGQFNQGKTWFLSALAGENFAKGNMTKTKGLSVKTPLGKLAKNFVILDTEGSDSCVSYDHLDDKRATESFLRELALKLSTVVIIVVNRLRRSDQTYLKSIIRNLYEEQKLTGSFKPLYVLHNFKDTASLDDVQQLITEEIVGVFGAKRQSTSLDDGKTENHYWHSKIYSDHLEKKEIPLQHFVVATSGSPAGKYWNRPTIEIIRRLIENSPTRRAYNLLDEVREFSAQRLPAYVRVPHGSSLCVSLDKPNGLFTVSFEPGQHDTTSHLSSSSPPFLSPLSLSLSPLPSTEPASSYPSPSAPSPALPSAPPSFLRQLFNSSSSVPEPEQPIDDIPPPHLLLDKLELLDLSYDDAGCITNVVSPQGIVAPPYNIVEFPEHYDLHVDLAAAELGQLTRAPNGRAVFLSTRRTLPRQYQLNPEARYLRKDIHYGELGFTVPFSNEIEGDPTISRKQDIFFIRYRKKDMLTVRPDDVPIFVINDDD